MPVGLIIGLPALRLRGVNLAVVTLGFAAAMDATVFNSQSFTGGTAGLPIPEPRLPGLNLAISQGKSYPTVIFGVVVLVVVILLGLLVARLRRGPAGRMLLAIRSNERAAGSVGINVAQGKLMAFGLAAFIAGIGGALTGYMQGELTPDSFAAFTSIGLLAIVFVAGVGRIAGAVVAGIMFSAAGLFVTFLNLHLNVGKYQAIVAGVALVLTAVQNPDGITGTATGKGPAVALAKLRDRAAGEYAKRFAGRRAAGPGARASKRRDQRRTRRLLRHDGPPCRPGRAHVRARSSEGTPGAAGTSRPCAGGCRTGRRSSTPTGCAPTTASTPGGWTARTQSFVRLPVFDRSRRSAAARVKVWTDLGESEWSDPVALEAGLLSDADWSARWIGVAEGQRPAAGFRPAYWLRTTFATPPASQARLYVTALGLYEAFLDGRRVGDVELAPGYTQYRARVQYQSYDVTPLVPPGRHVLAVLLADGWYRGQVGLPRAADQYGQDLALRAQLEVRTGSGWQVVAGSGPGWRVAPSHITAADLIGGQREDRRRLEAGVHDRRFDGLAGVRRPGGGSPAPSRARCRRRHRPLDRAAGPAGPGDPPGGRPAGARRAAPSWWTSGRTSADGCGWPTPGPRAAGSRCRTASGSTATAT